MEGREGGKCKGREKGGGRGPTSKARERGGER